MRIYIACAVTRIPDYNRIRAALEAAGHTITFPWADTCLGQLVGADRDAEHAHLQERSRLDIDGVCTADCVVALLPARFGTHAEIGAALGRRIPVVLHAESDDEIWQPGGGYTCAFYHDELVRWAVMPFEWFVQRVARACEIAVMLNARRVAFNAAKSSVARTDNLTVEQCIDELKRIGSDHIVSSGVRITVEKYAETAPIGDLQSLIFDYRVLNALEEPRSIGVDEHGDISFVPQDGG